MIKKRTYDKKRNINIDNLEKINIEMVECKNDHFDGTDTSAYF